MPRNSNGVMSKPVGTTAVSGQPISSSNYNEVVNDFVADANSARPVSAGGTGKTSLTSGRFMIGNGSNSVNIDKVVPTGAVVGTTDIQSLTNKTLTSPALESPTITGTLVFPDNSVALTGIAQIADFTLLGNVSGGTANVSTVSILDEDDFASNSDTALATQASIKAFVEGSSTLSEDGYIDLPGVQLRWGSRTSSIDASQSFSFSPDFSNACFGVVTTPTANDARVVVPVTSKTAAAFTVDRNDDVSGDYDFFFIAIGH